MSKRDVIKIGKKSYYAERNKKGQFVDVTNIGKSIKADSKKKTSKTVKPGHGHEGDLKRKR
ncbi:hypothetical protein A2215_01540 [Candidatus Berkelbacteria bacterium RIFOXYA2_FULL_43_10]|uniref:Uncharacterized protein n=1 Tax=Candidatus Berkelbacteria bacterium RIFOXYA2_FULL_43_10 TaxID=1797472 RepID=A0A1F5E723_9BACT|nr:MAG: hypothetical protein A2215_01540 [Candidatus Berkelbacteria bacterium RIFOXYA2_FULL_43_10]